MNQIRFDEGMHAYFNENNFILPSVTQILGQVYGTGLENAQEYFVNRAAEKGTAIHKEIESYLKTGQQGTTPEFWAWHKWFNYANGAWGNYENEKIIYAKTPSGSFAGTLDFFGNGFIFDWKTCKTATRQQIDKWQKQLSFYCYAMRQLGYTVNEPLKIMHLTGGAYEVINVDYLGDAFVEKTMSLYQDIVAGNKTQEQAILSQQQELKTVSAQDLQVFEDTLVQIDTLQKVADDFREKIKAEMERRKILNLQVGRVKLTYVPPTVRQSFDSKAFKNDDPDLYALYLKSSDVKSSLRITVK